MIAPLLPQQQTSLCTTLAPPLPSSACDRTFDVLFSPTLPSLRFPLTHPRALSLPRARSLPRPRPLPPSLSLSLSLSLCHPPTLLLTYTAAPIMLMARTSAVAQARRWETGAGRCLLSSLRRWKSALTWRCARQRMTTTLAASARDQGARLTVQACD